MNGLTWVDREKLGEDRWRALKTTLLLESRESKRYAVGGDDGPRHLQLWQERGSSAGIPRYFALKQLGLRYEGSSCPAAGIPWNGPPLRLDQQAAVMQAEAMARRWGGVILQAKPGTGKCIRADSLVFTEQGIVQIGHLVQSGQAPDTAVALDMAVQGPRSTLQMSAVFNGGVQDTLRIRTKFGFELEGTPEHPVLTFDSSGQYVWKMLSDVQAGDYVVVRRGADTWGQTPEVYVDAPREVPGGFRSKLVQGLHLDERTAEVVGLLVAEGDLWAMHSVAFHNKDKEVVAVVRDWASAAGVPFSHKRKLEYNLNSIVFRRFLLWAGMRREHSRNKTIPARVLTGGRAVVAAFLRGYFEGDGHVARQHVEVSSASEQLIRQVQVCLLGLGVLAAVTPKWNKKYQRNYWRLTIYGGELQVFQDAVGFLCSRKKEALAQLVLKLSQVQRNPNVTVIPHTAALFQALQGEAGDGWDAAQYGRYSRGDRDPNRVTLRAVAGRYPHLPAGQQMAGLAGEPFEYLRVEGKTAGRAHVVDLVVPGEQAFVGNGIVCHNTPMGTALARALGARTLIVVHKGYHLEHWRGDIVKFTGLPPERIGLIRGDKVELGAEFTLGVLDSIAEKEYGPAVWDYFGHVCSDEIHKHGATTYSKAMQRFTARYLTGLSATPDRADGMELAFEYQVGPVINPQVESVCLPTKVYAMGTGIEIPARYLLRNQQTGEDKINLGGVVSFLAKNKQRTAALANVVRAAVSKGRHVLVFSHRLDHLKQFKSLLGGMASLFLGGMDAEDLAEAVKVPVLLSTYQMAQDAMNVPRLDTLVIATPMVSLEQAIGRIQRPHPDKKDPLVVDPVDGGPIGTQMYLSRRAMYARLGIADAE